MVPYPHKTIMRYYYTKRILIRNVDYFIIIIIKGVNPLPSQESCKCSESAMLSVLVGL